VRIGWLTRGRWLRGVLAWIAGAAVGALAGATLTVLYLMTREAIVAPPFAVSDWWLFVNMWRPLIIAGAVLVPLYSALPAALAVALIRRRKWPRPAADVIAGALSGLLAIGLVILTARLLNGLGES